MIQLGGAISRQGLFRMPGPLVTILTDGKDIGGGWRGKRESNGWPHGARTRDMMT